MHSLPVPIKCKRMFHSTYYLVFRSLLGSAHSLILSIVASLLVLAVQYHFDHHENIKKDFLPMQIATFDGRPEKVKINQQRSLSQIGPVDSFVSAAVATLAPSSVEKRKRVIAKGSLLPRLRRKSFHDGADAASEGQQSPSVVVATSAPPMPRIASRTAVTDAAISIPPASFMSATAQSYAQSQQTLRPLSQGLKFAASAGAFALTVNSLMISGAKDAFGKLPDGE